MHNIGIAAVARDGRAVLSPAWSVDYFVFALGFAGGGNFGFAGGGAHSLADFIAVSARALVL